KPGMTKIAPRRRLNSAANQTKNPQTGNPGATQPDRRGPGLRDFEIFRRRTAAVGDQFILDRLALVERPQSGALDCRDMDKHVLLAVRRLDEAVAPGGIKPFDGALLHRLSPSQSMPTKTKRAPASSVAVANRATTQILGEVRNDHVKDSTAASPNPIVSSASPTNTAQAWLHDACASAAEHQNGLLKKRRRSPPRLTICNDEKIRHAAQLSADDVIACEKLGDLLHRGVGGVGAMHRILADRLG